MSRPKAPPILGIDLGTTTSMACYLLEGQDETTPVKTDRRFISPFVPSVICKTDDVGVLVGEAARQKLSDPQYRQDVIRCAKLKMHKNGKIFPKHSPIYTPIDVSAHILGYLREATERQLGLSEGAVTEAVITVPAYFGQTQRRNTRLAAKDAGFDPEKVRLLDEPIAAAIGLRLHEQPGDRLVMVIDLGGGTLDVTLLRVGKDVGGCGFQEIGRDGYDQLGGIKWDQVIAKLAFYQHKELVERELAKDEFGFTEPDNIGLYDPCELAKIDFCSPENGHNLNAQIVFTDEKWKPYDSIVTRQQFVHGTARLSESVGVICDRLLKSVPADELRQLPQRNLWRRSLAWGKLMPLTWRDIDHVYMVGGGSRVPAVQEVIQKRWGKTPEIPSKPQHVVAFGAARCAEASRPRLVVQRFASAQSPHDRILGVSGPEGRSQEVLPPVIRRNQRILESNGRPNKFGVTEPGTKRCLQLELAEERIDPDDQVVDREKLGDIVLDDLPPPHSRKKEYGTMVLNCLNEREMLITVEFRGKKKTVDPDKPKSFK